MAIIKDEGYEETEDLLEKIEKEIKKEYTQAESELQEKLDEYLSKFEKKDELKRLAVENGQITQEEYETWRVGQIAIGERWEEMKETISEDLANTSQIAKSVAYGYMPEVYAINHNYGTYQAEAISGIDTSYTLYNSASVEYLFKDGDFYLPAGKKVTQAINMGKQVAWDKKQVQSVMIQSLLQGESIGKIATRLSKQVGESDRKAAIRNARTMTTCVQNVGRLNSFERAKNRGINIKKQWLATLDNRTRHEHRALDGQVREIGEPFEVDGYELEYPADPNASVSEKLKMQKAVNVIKGPAHLIYNCRCTILGVLEGHEIDVTDTSIRNTNKMEEESYEEWKNAHSTQSDSITKQDEIEDTMKKAYGAEYKSYSSLNKTKNNGKIKKSSETSGFGSKVRFKTGNTTDSREYAWEKSLSASNYQSIYVPDHVISALKDYVPYRAEVGSIHTKEVGNFSYTFEYLGHKEVRVISKEAIPDAVTELFERIPYKNGDSD